jgi:lysophospholipase L1-like esterase
LHDELANLLTRGGIDEADGNSERVEVTNLAKGGETSASLISDGQLSRAVEVLEHADDAADHLITLTIGGNDAVRLLPVCGSNAESQPSDACLAAADTTLSTLRENLVLILGNLREAAGPDALIIVSTYYNSLQHPRCLFHPFESLAAPSSST